MLSLRPNCELCDCDLPPDSSQARICSYECTFCADCVNDILSNVCPNCGGGFSARPIRPKHSWRPTTGLAIDPATTQRTNNNKSLSEIQSFCERIKSIDVAER